MRDVLDVSLASQLVSLVLVRAEDILIAAAKVRMNLARQ